MPASRHEAGPQTDDDLEAFLLTAEVISMDTLAGGVTRPYRVVLRRDGREARAVFKNVDMHLDRKVRVGGRVERDFTDRYQYEVAAYRLDRLLGLGMVPVTVVRNIAGEPGSLQLWIDEAINEAQRLEDGVGSADPEALESQKNLMNVFDVLIHNVDRNENNILYTRPDWKLYMIDHSRAFRTRRDRPVALRKADLLIPPPLQEALEALTPSVLRGAMDGLLTEDQIDAILVRRDRLLNEWGRTAKPPSR